MSSEPPHVPDSSRPHERAMNWRDPAAYGMTGVLLLAALISNRSRPAPIGAPLSPAATPARSSNAALTPIDPNTAPWYELAALPRIGEQLAKRIVAYRDQAARPPAFRTLDDLSKVRGIGAKTVARLAPFLLVPE